MSVVFWFVITWFILPYCGFVYSSIFASKRSLNCIFSFMIALATNSLPTMPSFFARYIEPLSISSIFASCASDSMPYFLHILCSALIFIFIFADIVSPLSSNCCLKSSLLSSNNKTRVCVTPKSTKTRCLLLIFLFLG